MHIPVLVHERTKIDRQQDILVGGVPVRRGKLKAGGWFELQGPTGAFPVEGTPAAFWPDGSVKWLHLCGQVNLAGGKANPFKLVPSKTSGPQGLQVASSPGEIRVQGGVLDVTVRSDVSNLLTVLRGEKTVSKGPGLSASMIFAGPDGSNRRTFSLHPDKNGPAVAVQSANRVVVRLGAKFLDASGNTGAELILFIEILREAPELRIEPVWIYLGQPMQDLVEALTLTAHVPIKANESQYGFGDERGAFWDVIQRIRNDERGGDGPRWPMARQMQTGSSFYRTEKLTFPQDASWVKAVEGQRAQGWCHLADDTLGVTAAMRYFWQEYPHSLTVNSDEGTLQFGLVPADAERLDLRRYSPVIYGATMYESGGNGPFNVDLHGAYGIAKTHELMLRFHVPEEKDIAERGLFFTQPSRPMAAAKYLAASKVLGPVAPATPSSQKQGAELSIRRIIEFLIHEREVRGWYGLMNFGDVMSSFYSDQDRWAFDDGGYAWLNTESLPDYGLWITALRSARADWLEASIEMSRHNRDVDCYHRGQLKGLGSRHNVNHWGDADKEWRVSMPLARRLHYYITADPWTSEYIRETVAVYQSYERTKALAPSGTSALAGVMTKWEMFNDPADEKTLRNMADAYAAAVRPDGQFTLQMHMDFATGKGHPEGEEPHGSTFFMNTFGGQHALIELATLLDHKPLAEALVRHADHWVRLGQGGVGVLGWLTHAWRMTGEQRFMDAMKKAIETLEALRGGSDTGSDIVTLHSSAGFPLEEVGGDSLLDTPRHSIMPNFFRRNKVTCHGLGDVMHMPPYALEALSAPRSAPRSKAAK